MSRSLSVSPPRARILLWAAFGCAALAVAGLAMLRARLLSAPADASPVASSSPASVLPALGQLPPFTLTDQTGHPFGLAQMAGRPWVADFIFTGCGEACPRLTAQLKLVGARLPAQVGLLSISVDPAHDTPERLSDYAKGYQADATRWKFLTGTETEVDRAVVEGFHVMVERSRARPPERSGDPRREILEIAHGEKLVLVDAKGGLRGYYDADAEGLAQLERDARRLLPTTEGAR